MLFKKTREQCITVVVLLDEFKSMLYSPAEFDEPFLRWLRACSQDGKVAMVVATRQPLGGIERFDFYFANFTLDESDPRWYEALKSTRTLPVTYLRREDACHFFTKPAPDFPDGVYEPAAVERVLNLTNQWAPLAAAHGWRTGDRGVQPRARGVAARHAAGVAAAGERD
jgi:hypothetical protein